MASRRFPLLFTSLIVTAVVVLYIISSKIENEAPKVPQMLSWKENTRIHNNEFTLTSRLGLKNEVNPSLSYEEKLFKLYDGVETFVMFIGYPRSGHSLVGAILDAHPEIIISHQYNVIKHWRKYISSTQKNLQKYQLFFGIHKLSRDQALFGNRASPSNQTRYLTYNYHVPGSWQGKYQEKIKVIGDKNGGNTALALRNLSNMRFFEEIIQVVQVPIKLIHVTRNPFDNISTMMLRATHSRDAARKEGVKMDNKQELDALIKEYFQMAASNQRVRERYGDAVLDIPAHETVLRPKETLLRLCDYLGVTCYEGYLEKCIKILYGSPSFTRNKVVWTEEQKERVTEMIKSYPFLKEYSFDKYPS